MSCSGGRENEKEELHVFFLNGLAFPSWSVPPDDSVSAVVLDLPAGLGGLLVRDELDEELVALVQDALVLLPRAELTTVAPGKKSDKMV